MADLDQETQAIGQIASVIDSLGEEQRGRVIRYIVDRFSIPGAYAKKPTAGSDLGEVNSHTDHEFQDLASLFAACEPNTDSLRALVGAYWIQICENSQNFDGQSVNKELKHLGHGIANITKALHALIAQKPALVLQLRKSGTTRQARKLYKITDAGVKKVKAMIAGTDTE